MKVRIRNFFKLFLLICLAYGHSLSGSGQIQIGINGGYNIFHVFVDNTGRDNANYEGLNNSFAIGFTASHSLSNVVNLAYCLEYLKQSYNVMASWGGAGGGSRADLDITAHIIDIQMYPQFVFGNKVTFFFYPGISLSKVVHSSRQGVVTAHSPFSPDPVTDTINDSAQDLYPWMQFGLLIGCGLDIPVTDKISVSFENKTSFDLGGPTFGSTTGHFLNSRFLLGVHYYLKSKNPSITIESSSEGRINTRKLQYK